MTKISEFRLLKWLREKTSLTTVRDLKRHTFVANYLFVFMLLTYLLITGAALYVDVMVYGWFDFRTILVNVSVLIIIAIVAIQIRVLKYMRWQRKLEEREMQPDTMHRWVKQRGVEPPIWSIALPEFGVIGGIAVRGECPGTAIGEFWFTEEGQMKLHLYEQKEPTVIQ